MRNTIVSVGFVVFCIYLGSLVSPLAQTRLPEEQLRLKVRVVEWAKCQASGIGKNLDGTTYTWDCTGLELYRFQMSDGSIRGPFIVIPASPDFVQDSNWVVQ